MVVTKDFNTLPVDRGWAWMIAASGFIAHAVMGVVNTCHSVLFVEILQEHDANITMGSLMFMCGTLAYSVSSVVTATYLMPKIGERACLIIGGVLNFGLCMGVSMATNIGVIIAMIGLKGVANGMILVPAITLIRIYFVKLRSRASIVPWCGGSAASIIAPFIIREIRKEYGVSGTYFIMSAVELNVCLAGLLLRPVSSYRLPSEDRNQTSNDKRQLSEIKEDNADSKEIMILKYNQIMNPNEKENGNEKNVESAKEALIAGPVDETTGSNLGSSRKRTSSDPMKNKDGLIRRERNNSYFGSVLTLDSEIGTVMEVMLGDVTDSTEEKGLTRWQKIYQDSSLELRSLRWMLLGVFPGSVNGFLLSYFPSINNSLGASLDQAALLVTIMGSVDLVCRALTGFIADTHRLPPSILFSISQMCLGVACHLLRLCTSFETLVPLTVFIGLFIGTRATLLPLICIEVVGTEKMPQVYSIMGMLNTLFAASLNPSLGAVIEATGSFVPALHVVGSGFILCSILIAFVPFFARMDVKHGRKQ